MRSFKMGYYDKEHGTTVIEKSVGRFGSSLTISVDYYENPKELHPVLLYVPNDYEDEHHHIELSKESALELKNWLEAYLKENP
jgi:hypothetical protein